MISKPTRNPDTHYLYDYKKHMILQYVQHGICDIRRRAYYIHDSHVITRCHPILAI